MAIRLDAISRFDRDQRRRHDDTRSSQHRELTAQHVPACARFATDRKRGRDDSLRKSRAMASGRLEIVPSDVVDSALYRPGPVACSSALG